MSASGKHPVGVPSSVVRMAAMSDLHYGRDSRRHFKDVFEQVAETADILVICGDLTHRGLPEEIAQFLEDTTPVLGKIPVLCVLGNHDFESEKEDELAALLVEAGVIMLDGNCLEIRGIGFTGVKGFGGGFGRWALHPWGETVVKDFVKESRDESRKLEAGLSKMNRGPRIVVLHYAPVTDTLVGEPLELSAFLGSSRLEEPVNQFGATAVFHGHAHKGRCEGRTSAGIPVYNVAAAVLMEQYPGRPPFFLLEISLD